MCSLYATECHISVKGDDSNDGSQAHPFQTIQHAADISQPGWPGSIVRHKNFKLIQYHEDNRLELYDLSNDIGERSNVLEKYPEIANDLLNKMKEMQKDTNARFPSAPKLAAEKTKRDLKLANIGAEMEALEKRQTDFLSEDYKLNNNWWGSKVED